MALSSKHSKSVQNMAVEQLKAVISNGTLLAAAAKAELVRRGVEWTPKFVVEVYSYSPEKGVQVKKK